MVFHHMKPGLDVQLAKAVMWRFFHNGWTGCPRAYW